MAQVVSVVSVNDSLSLSLAGGERVHNLGDGLVAVDQLNETTKAWERVVMSTEDMRAILAWAA